MAQAFLLKTDVAITGSITSQKHIKNQATSSDDRTVESFSSALDKQVDKQAIQQHKKNNKIETDDKLVKSADKVDTKTELSTDKSGKKLPDELAQTSEQLDGADEEQLIIAVEVLLSTPTEELEAESSSDDVLTATIDAVSKSNDTIDIDHHTATMLVDQTEAINKNEADTSNKVQVTEISKLVGDILLPNKVNTKLTEQENGHSEHKQPAQSLRSDILNALLKKANSEGENLASAQEQKILANSALTISKEGLSEEQKIMALADNVKLKGTLATGGAFERSAGVSSALLTPASSNAMGAAPAVTGQPTLNLQPALHSEAWSRVLSSRVIWMAREGVQQASLKLNPANMGSVEVKLHMHNDQATISFIAQHAATRDALEQALPRLRESFQENGMELAHADVSQENFSQADEQDNKTTNNSSTSTRDNDDAGIESTTDDNNIGEQDIALGLSVFA